MTYTPHKWVNGKKPAINAENLNAMDEAIARLFEMASVPDITATTSTTQPNSYAGREHILEIGGVTEQETTEGNQLFNKYDIEIGQINNSTGVLESGELAITRPIHMASESDYTLSHSLPNGVRVFFYDEADNHLSNALYGSGVHTFTTPQNTSYIRMKSSNTAFSDEIMLNEGTTALPYEKYTGGIPAPNPSYPMEIKKTVVSEVKTHWKNLLNCYALKELTNNGVTFTPVYDKKGSLQYINANGTATDSAATFIVAIPSWMHIEVGEKYILSGCPGGGSTAGYKLQFFNTNGNNAFAYDLGSGAEFVFSNEGTDYNVAISIYKGNTVNNLKFYPMIREASVEDATYEPYTESVATLSQPIELYGIEDVQDVIVQKNGVYGVERNFRVDEINRSAEITANWPNQNTSNSLYCNVAVYKDVGLKPKGKCASNRFVHNEEIWSVDEGSGFHISKKNAYRVRITDVLGTISVDEFKTWLDANETYFIAETEAPTFEALPTADQIALNSLATYDGITYVEFDAEIQPTFKGEYGTSKVGGYTLEALLAGRNGELK